MIKITAVVFGAVFAANVLGTVVYYLVHKR
jgi:hypothetical protein